LAGAKTSQVEPTLRGIMMLALKNYWLASSRSAPCITPSLEFLVRRIKIFFNGNRHNLNDYRILALFAKRVNGHRFNLHESNISGHSKPLAFQKRGLCSNVAGPHSLFELPLG